jgi:hypothetical protein
MENISPGRYAVLWGIILIAIVISALAMRLTGDEDVFLAGTILITTALVLILTPIMSILEDIERNTRRKG